MTTFSDTDMLNTFRAYDPSTLQAKSYSTACETCYSRKVKCELLEDGGSTCKQCADHGVECKARTRKRKAHSIDEGQRGREDHAASQSSGNASGSRPEASDLSNGASKRRMSSISSTKPHRALQRTGSVSVPELFVNRDSGTGFSPESSEHTEPQDRFRNASFLSRSAILGEDFQDIDHAHTERVISEDKVSSAELKVLKLHGAFELPDLPLRQSLIEAYIERCYTWMPVVDLWTFTAGASQAGEGSLLLLQAVVLVGSLMRPDVCGKGFCDRQYQRVKALIHSGYERDPLNILAACCLVQWYTPTAPKDISTDVPRFWNTYAVGLAQQMGLQRPPNQTAANPGRRNRIWWTMVARDNLTASAHGRPRIIQPEDCTVFTPTFQDFASHGDMRAEIFIYYVLIARILGDLCQIVTRNGEASFEDKHHIANRLHNYLESLPEHLRVYDPHGLAQQYSLELAQLHVPILISVTILFRPSSVYQLTAANAGSVTAAFLSFRIFQAIQLREQTRFLSSLFSWHLLVTAIPLLSCTKVAALRDDANEALDSVENVLETLGKVRPSAAVNLRSVRAMRKAMASKTRSPASAASTTAHSQVQDSGSRQLGRQILQAYGLEAVHQFEHMADILGAHNHNQADRSAHAAAHTLSCLSGRQDADVIDGRLTPEPDAFLTLPSAHDDIQDAFTAVFEDDTLLNNSWMMRDWMDELQL